MTSASRPSVLWHGHLFDASGFADEGRNFVLGLDSLGVPVGVAPFHVWDARRALARDELARLQALVRTPPRAPAGILVSVVHDPPVTFRRVAGADYHVGRAMFETDRIPDEWLARCALMDEIWVPSAFNVESFSRSGVPASKLVRVPGSIDVARFSPPARPLAVRGRRRFNFLSVFGWSLRKGWDVLLRAFVEEFGPDEDVALIVKTWPPPRRTMEDLRREALALLRSHGLCRGWPPHVVLDGTLLDAGRLAALHAAADAFVLPTRGEGWGRPFMEAMLMQRPVIATRASGHLDFLGDENAFLIDCVSREVPRRALRDFPVARPHRWAEPSRTHLRRLMRLVLEDRTAARLKARAARETILAGYGREHVGRQVRRHLERIADTVAGVRAVAAPPPEAGPARDMRPARATIVWEGAQLVHHSLARVNRELGLQLMDAGCELSLHAYEIDAVDWREDERFARLADRIYAALSRPRDVHVSHRWPPQTIPPAEGHWVVMQPWEFGSLPRAWREPFSRQADEVWVPSRHVQQGYVESGLAPERVAVIPNGVNPDQFHPGVAPLDLGRPAEFRFLFVGGTLYRKGIDLLLRAYRQAFKRSDDVCLVLKDFGVDTVYRGQTWGRHIRALQARGDGPAILHLESMLSERELPALYRACDVLVHPYRGEGFGLPILESMASGVPAIVTDGGACRDFCTGDNSVLVPAVRRWLPRGLLGAFETVRAPWVYEVDVRALAEAMRHAYEHPAQMRALGTRASDAARTRWTWRHSALAVLQRIEALRDRPVLRRRPTTPAGPVPRARPRPAAARSSGARRR